MQATKKDPGATISRVDFLVREIGQRIVSGRYAPGATLPVEQELCVDFGVGRNAVREAIKTLSGKGFVRTVRRAGTIVESRSDWAMLDPEVLSWMLTDLGLRRELLHHLSQLRRIVEPAAAALAADHASITDMLRLFECYERMTLHRHDRARAIAADVEFHELLLAASRNPLIASMARSIGVLLHANFEISIESDTGFIRNLEQHGKVAEAIQRRDGEAARSEMLTLLSNNDEDLAQMIAASHGDVV